MYEHAYLRVICRDDMKTVRRPSDRDSSIRVTLASFQDGRHGPKMAAMTPRWPPWLQDVVVEGDGGGGVVVEVALCWWRWWWRCGCGGGGVVVV